MKIMKRYYIDLIGISILLGVTFAAYLKLQTLPDSIPLHWNLNGLVDHQASKYWIFTGSIASLGVYLLMTVVLNLTLGMPLSKNLLLDNEPARKVVQRGYMYMGLVKLSLMLLPLFYTISVTFFYPISNPLPMVLGGNLICILFAAFSIIKLIQNRVEQEGKTVSFQETVLNYIGYYDPRDPRVFVDKRIGNGMQVVKITELSVLRLMKMQKSRQHLCVFHLSKFHKTKYSFKDTTLRQTTMYKNSLFAYSIRLFTVLFLTLPLNAQTFSWGTLGTSPDRKCLSLNVCYDGSILAGSDGGLYRSFDNGITWQHCGLDSFEITCAVVDSAGRLFVCGGKQYEQKGVYCSKDSGNSWQKIGESSGLLLLVSNEVLLVASNAGILRSTDHGNSWNNVHTPSTSLSEQGIYSLCLTRDGTIYAGTMSNILRSTDQGKSWTVSIQIGSYNYMLAAGYFGDVFTFSTAQNGHAYLYRTIDQGEHWIQYYPELYEDGVSFVLVGDKWVQYGPGYYHFLGIVQDLYGRSFIICSNRKDSVVVMGTNGKIVQSLVLNNAESIFQNSSQSLAITPDGHGLIGLSGGGIYRSVSAIASPVIPSIKIAQAIADADHDNKPDNVGKTVTIVGVVNSTNLQGAEATQYTFQDGSGGIQLFKSGSGGPILKIGDAVLVTGTIAQEHGTTQIIPASFNDSVFHVIDSNQVLTKTKLTLQQFLANPKKYESQLVKVSGIAKSPNSPAWPGSGADANMVFWDGWDTTIVRIDKRANLSGTPEPIYPANISGVVTQNTSSASIYNDGYRLSPSNPTDFEGGIQVLPNPHFALVTPANGTTLLIDSTNQRFTFTWNKPIDLNGDHLAYRWAPFGGTAVPTGGSPTGADSFLVRTGVQLLAYLKDKDSVVLRWTVQTKDASPTIVSSVDTCFVTLIKGKILDGIATEYLLPTVFSLDQNYPNPFNPSTTLEYALPMNSRVKLHIYNVLGQQVAELVNGEQSAGVYRATWNANVTSGMYFYRIEAVSLSDPNHRFVETKKMILMR